MLPCHSSRRWAKTVRIELVGAIDDKDGFGMVEIAGKKQPETADFGTPGALEIMEAEIYEPMATPPKLDPEMKAFRWSLVLAVISMVTGIVDAEQNMPAARIARFSGDCAAAISYTFDDGLRDQYMTAVPMLNELGFRGTFFIIPSKSCGHGSRCCGTKKKRQASLGNHYLGRVAKHGCPRP